MIDSTINIDVRAALLNFYTIKRDMENRRNRLYINTLLVIARRVIYTLFYREDETVKNNIISYEFIKNIRLTLKFRRICLVFLNQHVKYW